MKHLRGILLFSSPRGIGLVRPAAVLSRELGFRRRCAILFKDGKWNPDR